MELNELKEYLHSKLAVTEELPFDLKHWFTRFVAKCMRWLPGRKHLYASR